MCEYQPEDFFPLFTQGIETGAAALAIYPSFISSFPAIEDNNQAFQYNFFLSSVRIHHEFFVR